MLENLMWDKFTELCDDQLTQDAYTEFSKHYQIKKKEIKIKIKELTQK
jgi:hypothetical protein